MITILMILLLIYVLISTVLGYCEIMKMKGKHISEKERIKFYRSAVLEGWLSIVFVIAAVAITDITVEDIGLMFLDIKFIYFNLWIKIAIFAGCGIFLILLIYQMIGYMVSKTYRKQVSEQLTKSQAKGKHYDVILSDIMLPKTRKEKRWFTVVSATAGLGEEIVYRGFLFFLLMSLFPNLPIYSILIVAGILFGIAHSYQGVWGVLKTSLVGIVFGALYIASGSLLPGILFHFIIDFSSNFLLSEEIHDELAKE